MNYIINPNIFHFAFLVFLSYFIILILYYAFLGVVGFIESKKWERKNQGEDYFLSYSTSFNLGVSIVVPARNEEVWVADTVKAILNLNYPKFELIIVDDGSTDKTLPILNEVLDLQPTEMVYIRHYKDGKTYDILRSKKHPQVTVVHKAKGEKKAGAVNAGLNIARYEYVCIIDGDTVLEQDSLLKVMAEVQKDPERVVGIGSYFGLSNYFKVKDGVIMEKRFSYRPIIAFQNLEYIRSFFGSRVSWSKFNAMPIVAGGFGVWRRDILYELGGYSAEFTCEDLEFTLRVHKYITDNQRPYRIVMLPYHVSWTDGPSNIRSLVRQRSRWQRVEFESIWEYKTMLLNPRYGSIGFITFPYYVLYEIAGIFFEIASLLFVLLGIVLKVFEWKTFFIFLFLMVATQAIVSMISLLAFIRTQKVFPKKYIIYLVILSLVEFICYRWIITISKISGTLSYFRGIRIYDRYVREKRKK